jgi:O-antigen biosynthesis protein
MAAPLSLSGSDGAGADEFRGIKLIEVELCQPLPELSYDGTRRRVWVLVRLLTEPIGTCVVNVDGDGLTPAQFGDILWQEFQQAIVKRFAAACLPAPQLLTGDGIDVAAESWPFLRARSAVLLAPPFISVIVCTYNRPDQIKVCLEHLGKQQYPSFEVIVVDNNPGSDVVAAHVASLDARFRYVPEPRTGLSRARNTGVSAASADIVAFIDDDEEPDDFWLAALARGFARDSNVGCVTGLIAPARLDTEAQFVFEEIGGHSKGRGFEPAIFSAHGAQSPLYPQPPFGAGGNMAFRRAALGKIGRFDNALGAGTASLGAEDTLALTLVLLSGFSIAYEPAALVRHHHYRDFDSAASQLRGYAVGMGAFYLALVFRRPSVVFGLARLVPDAARYLRASRLQARQPAFPVAPELTSGRARQMLAGPPAYLRGVIRNASSGALRVGRRGQRRSGR